MNEFFKIILLGQKPHSTSGSNRRRLISRVSVIIILLLIIEAFQTQWFPIPPLALKLIAYFCVAWSIIFFIIVVLAIPFLTSENFQPNSIRLFKDAIISIILSIISFALIYRVYGIIPPEDYIQRSDYYYFSAVTFSTLGFGDFIPSINSRVFTGMQAILGNLHLGIIVAVTFFAAQPNKLDKNTDTKTDNDDSKSQ